MLEQVTTILAAILTRQHPCQMDLGDDEDQEDVGESSEYDWLVVETALDVVVGLSSALGPQFSEVWKMFEKSIIKMASSPDAAERSTATGAIGECIAAGMAEGVTPYTEKLLKLLLHRLSDEDPDVKSNAAYGIGLLIFHSTNSAAYLPSYNQILSKLEPLLSIEESTDNAAGCVSRMIMAHPERVPISEVIPALVKLLPLKKDFLENKPIYECIVSLCKFDLRLSCKPHTNSAISRSTQQPNNPRSHSRPHPRVRQGPRPATGAARR
jgi:importin-4